MFLRCFKGGDCGGKGKEDTNWEDVDSRCNFSDIGVSELNNFDFDALLLVTMTSG